MTRSRATRRDATEFRGHRDAQEAAPERRIRRLGVAARIVCFGPRMNASNGFPNPVEAERATVGLEEASPASAAAAVAGPAVPIRARCGCQGPRALPLRFVSDTLAVLRQNVGELLGPETPVLTYRCRTCKQIIALTARDLFLVDG